MDLKPGSNSVTFTVTQGKAQTSAQIFLWNYDDKIVISDIDGTITKSDALGHLFTMVGRDWTHAGVASLYTNIRSNGYQILYLTSRAIGQVSDVFGEPVKTLLRNYAELERQSTMVGKLYA